MVGKLVRLDRIFSRKSGKTIIVPLDHGITVGPISGLINLKKTVDNIVAGGANAIIGHTGLALHGYANRGKDLSFILHLSASTDVNPQDLNDKVIVNSVEQALKLGADGVSVHVNVGSKNESQQLKDLGRISNQCVNWGMPLIAMMYPRGEGLKGDPKSAEMVKLAVRVGAELGVDLIKTYYTGTVESMKEVVESSPVPVIIAGGSKLGDEETLKMIKEAMEAGCQGLSIGRNVFQHQTPDKLLQAAQAIVHNNSTVAEALNLLSSK